MPLDDAERNEPLAELARRRAMVWVIALCWVIVVIIAAASIHAWFAILAAVPGVVVTAMTFARYRQLVAAIERASR
jgi:hypothetical protein